MDIRKKFESQIKKKEAEIQRLEDEKLEIDVAIREAKAYMQGLQDMLKHVPDAEGQPEPELSIRPGSQVAKAHGILQAAGTPLHVAELLKLMGDDTGRARRAALSGQLGSYVRQGRFFTRPAPNTFGLVEWVSNDGKRHNEPSAPSVPDGFGSLE